MFKKKNWDDNEGKMDRLHVAAIEEPQFDTDAGN